MSQQAKVAASQRLIETEHEFFDKSGPLPTAWNEVRRFPRFYLRTIARAKVYPPKAAPQQAPKECLMLTCDLSRGGLAFLYKSLLFPGQRVDVVLHDNTERSLEVLWCRRIGDGCYWAGGRFMKAQGQPPASEGEEQPPEPSSGA
jgi:hypothetical protein